MARPKYPITVTEEQKELLSHWTRLEWVREVTPRGIVKPIVTLNDL